jgi:hypothetical protein
VLHCLFDWQKSSGDVGLAVAVATMDANWFDYCSFVTDPL